MQASSALIESIEELLQTAITRLTAEIKAETNPQRLETLLTLAFRARLPRIPTPARNTPDPVSSRTSPVPQLGRAAGSEHERPPESKSNANGVINTGSFSTGRANGAKHQEPEANQPGQQDRSSSPAFSPRTSPAPLRERMSSFSTGEGRANGAKHQQPEANRPSPKDCTSSPPLTTEEELDAIQLPASSLPPLTFTPMSDEEFNKLERQIGYPEANRRRLIRAQLARDHPSPNANSS